MQNIFFHILAALILIFAILTVTLKNTFRAVIAFAATLLFTGGLYLLLQAEFTAFMQILIYVGAVAVLTVFVIMLTSEIEDLSISRSNQSKGLGILFSLVLAILLIPIVIKISAHSAVLNPENNEIFKIGELFFSDYAIAFEITSILLLAALIGAIVIAGKNEKK